MKREVDRYHMYAGDGPGVYEEVEPGGEWVLWEDYKALDLIKTELVEALENLLAVREGKGGTKYHADDIARAAIAKARGEGK